ncbi:hypothetical protein ACOSP7_014599 [Xanthoceras sorbifolium]
MGGIAWSEEEDQLLKKCIAQYGEGKWHRIPLLSGLNRCPKSCRLRWMNYLRPNIRRGSFAQDEIDLIVKLHQLLGNRWSLIAARLPGRTGNDIKNYWNCHLSRKINAEDQNKEKLQITTKVEVLRPQPRHCNVATPMPVPPPLRLEEVPTQPSQEESSLSTPSILQHPEFEQSQNVESNEKPGNIEDVNFGELLVDFDLEQVILTDYQTSSNWEWNDDLMILDMDIWTHSF